MTPSLPQLLIVLLLVVLFFGRGRIASIMGDFGKGIKAFRQGVKEENKDHATLENHQSDETKS